MDINPDEFFSVDPGTPYFYSWNQDEDKPGPSAYKELPTTVSRQGHFPDWLATSTIPTVYSILRRGECSPVPITIPAAGKLLKTVYLLPPTMNEARSIFLEFQTRHDRKEVKLEPLDPELLLRTVTVSNIETAPLEGVDVYMLSYKQSRLHLYIHRV